MSGSGSGELSSTTSASSLVRDSLSDASFSVAFRLRTASSTSSRDSVVFSGALTSLVLLSSESSKSDSPVLSSTCSGDDSSISI